MLEAGSTARLAAFVAGARPFPADVERIAKRLLLDQLARQIAGAAMPWSGAVRATVRALGSGSGATSVWFGDALAVDEAAFVNGALGYGGDVVDTPGIAAVEAGAVVIPAVLAVAEQRRSTGRALLEGIVAGAEVLLRIAAAVTPHLYARGHDAPPAAGPFGAAAGCARLLGLRAAQTENAMAIAGSHAGGLLEYGRTGGSVARLHCGIPAKRGVRAALFAQAGITGPHAVLEGERGFLAVFAGDAHAALLTDGLGTRYALRELSIAEDFAARTAASLGERRARELAALVWSLDDVPDAAALLPLTRPA